MFDVAGGTVDPTVDPIVDLAALVRRLAALDVSSCDAAQLSDATRLARRLRGFLDSFEASVARRAGSLHAQGRSARACEVLARDGRMSTRDAKRAERRADVLASAPGMSAALSAGAITAGHADALAAAVAHVPEDRRDEFFANDADLARRASGCSPERFAEACRELVAVLQPDEGAGAFEAQRRQTRLTKFVNPRTGMYVVNAEFDPEVGTIVFAAIDGATRALLRAEVGRRGAVVDALAHVPEHVAAHALADLVRGGRTGRRGTATDLEVLIDVDTLVRGVHEHTVCQTGLGQPFPVATVRRLACTARIIPAVLGATGEVLDLGREQRLASRAQRRALRAMYSTCGWDGCTTPFHLCEIHHIDPWEQGGSTDIDNLVPLCVTHHHMVHEGGWRIELAAGRVLRIERPDGVLHGEVPLRGARSARQGADGASADREVEIEIDQRGRGRPPDPPPDPPADPDRLVA